MDLRDRRDLFNGFGDGLARAFELAATPAIFGLVGYGLDRWLGIVPVLTIVFSLVSLVVKGYVMMVEYDQSMRRLEADKPWARKPAAPAAPVERANG